MYTCVKTIRFSAIFSVLFAILTYIVSVNIESGFIQLYSIWMSNNFALTVAGGVFTGFFVMLLCEVQKYFENKRKAEDDMFAHIVTLYYQMYTIYRNIQDYLAHKSEKVPKNLLFYNMGIIEQEMGLISAIDYTTFSKKNMLSLFQKGFCKWINENLRPFTNSKYSLAIAVNQDGISNVKEGKDPNSITSTSPDTHKVLSILAQEIQPLLNKVDQQLQTIDNACGGRYSWQLRKQVLEKSWESILTDTFKSFLEKGSEYL